MDEQIVENGKKFLSECAALGFKKVKQTSDGIIYSFSPNNLAVVFSMSKTKDDTNCEFTCTYRYYGLSGKYVGDFDENDVMSQEFKKMVLAMELAGMIKHSLLNKNGDDSFGDAMP